MVLIVGLICVSQLNIQPNLFLCPTFLNLHRRPNSTLQAGGAQMEEGLLSEGDPSQQESEGTVPTHRVKETASRRLARTVTPCLWADAWGGERQAAHQQDRKPSQELLPTRWRCRSAVRTVVTRETRAACHLRVCVEKLRS